MKQARYCTRKERVSSSAQMSMRLSRPSRLHTSPAGRFLFESSTADHSKQQSAQRCRAISRTALLPSDGQREQFADSAQGVQGLGTDDNAICRIIGGCNYEELQAVQDKYFELYGRPLVEDIDSECSGDYKQAVICKCIEPVGEEDQMPEPNLTPLEDAISDYSIFGRPWNGRRILHH